MESGKREKRGIRHMTTRLHEICPNCGVRFKRDIFKECPGCGLIDIQYVQQLYNQLVSKVLEEAIINGITLYQPIDVWKELGAID